MKYFPLFVGIIALLTVGCSQQSAEQNEEPTLRLVRTITIGDRFENAFNELPGVVAANREAQLSFRISGQVEQLLVREGDVVNEGQLLAALDDADINIQLKSNQAAYNKALADFNRGKALVGNGTISQSDYNQLESNLAAAEASLESTKQNLLYAKLEAPFSGVVAKRDIENFEEVQAKQTVFILQDVSTIDIKIDIPESIMILTSEDSAPEVVAIFDAIPDQTFPLTFKEIATQADNETNTYEVTMSMPRVEGFNILPGMSVTARATRNAVQNEQIASTVYVPAHAVLEDGIGRYAFVAVSEGDGKATVQRKDVVTGSLTSVGLEIVSGLEKGEKLVVAGMSRMFDGLQVKVESE